MGTNNFHSKNTSCIYAIEPEEDTEDLIINLEDSFNQIDENRKKYNIWNFSPSRDEQLSEELKSYPATSIGNLYSSLEVEIDEEDSDQEIDIEFIPKIVSGYYAGSCLDFEGKICLNGDEYNYDEVKEIKKIIIFLLQKLKKLKKK